MSRESGRSGLRASLALAAICLTVPLSVHGGTFGPDVVGISTHSESFTGSLTPNTALSNEYLITVSLAGPSAILSQSAAPLSPSGFPANDATTYHVTGLVADGATSLQTALIGLYNNGGQTSVAIMVDPTFAAGVTSNASTVSFASAFPSSFYSESQIITALSTGDTATLGFFGGEISQQTPDPLIAGSPGAGGSQNGTILLFSGGQNGGSGTVQDLGPAVTPEPASLVMSGTATLIGLGYWLRRRRVAA